MSDTSQAVKPPVAAWQCELLRLTIFLSDPIDISGLNWWEEVVGSAAEATTTKPARGEHQQEGAFAGGRLILRGEPNRIDWVLIPTPEEEQEGFAVIGQF